MLEKTVGILIVHINERDPNIEFLIANVKGLHWRIQKTKFLPQDSSILTNEIENSIKENQISILIGDYTNEVAESLSNVFHQSLTTVNSHEVPAHARFLDEPHCSVFYIQGLIVIPLLCNIYKTFENILKPFFNNIAVNNYKITLNNECAKVQNGVGCRQGYEIGNVVYEYKRYKHIKKSIEDIEKCYAQYGPENVFISFNGGKDCTVLLHITLAVLKRNYPEYSEKPLCLYFQNVEAFHEINDFVTECESYYKLNILKMKKSTKEALTDILHIKPNIKACLMGTRRTDPFAEHLEVFQMTDPDWPQLMRVCPLLDWHYSEIWDYLLTLKVTYCTLYDMGYTSLGNVNNTLKNPMLRYIENGVEMHSPAYKLLDASQEREGRKGEFDKKLENNFIKS